MASCSYTRVVLQGGVGGERVLFCAPLTAPCLATASQDVDAAGGCGGGAYEEQSQPASGQCATIRSHPYRQSHLEEEEEEAAGPLHSCFFSCCTSRVTASCAVYRIDWVAQDKLRMINQTVQRLQDAASLTDKSLTFGAFALTVGG
jgi:hypothetical protein